MKDDLSNNRFLNDAIATAIRQDDAMREINKYASIVNEVNQWDEIKKAAVGITATDYITSTVDKMNLAPTALEEFSRTAEMKKMVDISDYVKSTSDKLNTASTIGLSSTAMEESRRIEDLRKSLTAPMGITGMVIEDMARLEDNPRFPVPAPVPAFDYSVFKPAPNPLHKVNKLLEKSESKQTEIVEQLKELVSQSQGTSGQNDKMLWWTKTAAIATIVATLLTYLGYQAGKKSSPSTAQPAATMKASPVVQPVPSHVPASPKK